MKKIPFYKYTSLGNNFIVIDEIETQILSEMDKSRFAFFATNNNYGVGADNFLVIQQCSEQVLADIHITREYWDAQPDPGGAEYIFRMFEPDGTEAFSCGNGLMCMAFHLSEQYGINKARFLTELPTGTPRPVSIGTHLSNRFCWANLGHPRPISPQMARKPPVLPYDGVVSTIDNLKIQFRRHDLAPISRKQSLTVSGYLVFTGEPHLVVFSDTGLSVKRLAETMFLMPDPELGRVKHGEKRIALGTWLLHHIGTYINKKYAYVFPRGINVNFVRRHEESNVLDYRCFERGINRETLACGTGALAVSCVARRLGLTDAGKVMVRPHRGRWDDPSAQMLVDEEERGWLLYGLPRKLVKGDFFLHRQSLTIRDRLGLDQNGNEPADVDDRCEAVEVCAG